MTHTIHIPTAKPASPPSTATTTEHHALPCAATLWAALQHSALIGVQRLPLPPALCLTPAQCAQYASTFNLSDPRTNDPSPDPSSAIAWALQAALCVNAQHPSEQLLRASAVAGVCEHAGWQPDPNLHSNVSIPEPAPPLQPARSVAHTLIPMLRHVLHNGPSLLQAYTLVTLHQHGRDWPPALLAQALDAGRQDTGLRALLLPVLGDRGRWLAQFNPAWRYACGVQSDANDAQIWEEGSITQRVAWLHSQRQRDPAQARMQLQTALAQLPAKERLPLVQALHVGLTNEDEPLLEQLLCDRSKEVRLHAAKLLSCLPDSAHSQRMCAWVRALLQHEQPDGAKAQWTIQAPEEADPAWQHHGVCMQPETHFKGGPRAWWLQELLAFTPLSFWHDTLGLEPEALVRWARHSDWKAPLLEGWLQALQTQHDTRWIAAVHMMPSNWRTEQVYRTLHEQLSSAQRQTLWLQRLHACSDGAAPLIRVLEPLLRNWPAGQLLSPALSQAVFARLMRTLSHCNDADADVNADAVPLHNATPRAVGPRAYSDWSGHQATGILLHSACTLADTEFEPFIAFLQQPGPEPSQSQSATPLPWQERNVASQIDHIVGLRRALHVALSTSTSTSSNH